jgi:hypothetical protein
MSKPYLAHVLTDGTYKRTFSAEIDSLTEHELLVKGEMRDGAFALQHSWRLRTPDYEILAASASQLSGELDAQLCETYSRISGVRIGRGFSRNVLNAMGEGVGQREHLLLAIEMARVGQQVYQFPPEFEAQFTVEDANDDATGIARTAWLKDRAYMTDIANSCYTYRDESERLFDSREVRCGFATGITRPRPGEKRVFWREKQVSITPQSDGALFCSSAMQDTIHDIRVEFDISSDGLIGRASSSGSRLPYYGICEDAQLRTPGLEGLRVTSDFVRQFADVIGGRSGCTHLFDLSIDCLRLFDFL